MSSSITSTPNRKTTSQAKTPNTPPSQRHQKDLLPLIDGEIEGQTWEYPASVIARMLSPKRLKSPLASSTEFSFIDDFDCLIEQSFVEDALATLPTPSRPSLVVHLESPNYEIITNFLNECVLNCKSAYDNAWKNQPTSLAPKLKERGKHWWPELGFFVFTKPMSDKIDNAPAIKPDCIGSHVIPGDKPTCCWAFTRLLDGEVVDGPVGADISVEVKNEWMQLIRQSGSYARAQMGAVPLRAFSLAIAVNHAAQTLRYLVFHHGGLTASEELDLTSTTGCRKIQHIFFSIYLWQTPEDAGFPSFTDGCIFQLPSSKDPTRKFVTMELETIHHHALSLRGRNTWVATMKLSQGKPPLRESFVSPRRSNRLRGSKQVVNQVQDTSKVKASSKEPKPSSKAIQGTATSKDKPSSKKPEGKVSSRRQTSTEKRKAPSKKASTPKQEASAEESKPMEEISSDIMRIKKYHKLPLVFTPPVKYFKPDVSEDIPKSVTVKFSWPANRKKTLEPTIYFKCHGDFGTPFHVMSFEAVTPGGIFSNAHFLPRRGEEAGSFKSLLGTPMETPPDYRSLWGTITKEEGQSLEECETAWDLCECLLHAMLGWLSYYQHGYLQRDCSIGNIMKLKTPGLRKAPSTRNVCKLLGLDTNDTATAMQQSLATSSGIRSSGDLVVDSSSNVESVREGVAGLSIEDTTDNFWNGLLSRVDKDVGEKAIVELARELETKVLTLGITEQCKAILNDGDMAAVMQGYFDSDKHDGSISGTPEFMSKALRLAIDECQPYIQSPVDDLWSFFWVALWAVVFNIKVPANSLREKNWQKELRSTAQNRTSAADDIRKASSEEYSTLVRVMSPMFKDWFNALDDMESEWMQAWKKVVNGTVRQKELVFHRFAYYGVLEFVKLIERRSEYLQNPPSM